MRNFAERFNKFEMLTVNPFFCPFTDTCWTSSEDLSVSVLIAKPDNPIVSLLYISAPLPNGSVSLMSVCYYRFHKKTNKSLVINRILSWNDFFASTNLSFFRLSALNDLHPIINTILPVLV